MFKGQLYCDSAASPIVRASIHPSGDLATYAKLYTQQIVNEERTYT